MLGSFYQRFLELQVTDLRGSEASVYAFLTKPVPRELRVSIDCEAIFMAPLTFLCSGTP